MRKREMTGDFKCYDVSPDHRLDFILINGLEKFAISVELALYRSARLYMELCQFAYPSAE